MLNYQLLFFSDEINTFLHGTFWQIWQKRWKMCAFYHNDYFSDNNSCLPVQARDCFSTYYLVLVFCHGRKIILLEFSPHASYQQQAAHLCGLRKAEPGRGCFLADHVAISVKMAKTTCSRWAGSRRVQTQPRKPRRVSSIPALPRLQRRLGDSSLLKDSENIAWNSTVKEHSLCSVWHLAIAWLSLTKVKITGIVFCDQDHLTCQNLFRSVLSKRRQQPHVAI